MSDERPLTDFVGRAEQQHLDWVTRSYGRADYAPLRRSDVELIRAVGETVAIHPGNHLFKEGGEPQAVYLVEAGEVEVYRGSGATRRVVVGVGPGSVLGDVAVLSDTPYISSVQAVTAVRALRFERNRLLSELARYPVLLRRWLVAGHRQLEEGQRHLIRMMHKTILAQVADLLLEESERRTEVKVSQSTIAMLLGVSRQSVNEALGLLREQGAVETGYRRINVLDRDRLADIAGS